MANETTKAVVEVEAAKVADKVEKTTAKKAEKAEKTTAKKTTKKAEKTTAKVADKAEKTTAKKAEKAEKKTAAKKTTKKVDVKRELFIQYNDNQLDEATLLERVQADCEAQGVAVKELKLYLKPQDNACYYVANGNVAGKVDLF